MTYSRTRSSLLIFCILFFQIIFADENVILNVSAQQHQTIPLLLSVVGKNNKKMQKIAEVVTKNLEYSYQFTVVHKNYKTIPTKSDFEKMAADESV